jgi:PAS domain S-box-containing protein
MRASSNIPSNKLPRPGPEAAEKVLDSLSLAVITTSITGDIRGWNASASDLFGFQDDHTVTGRSVYSFLSGICDVVDPSAITAALKKGCTWTGQVECLKSTQGSFPAIVNASPLNAANPDDSGAVFAITPLDNVNQVSKGLEEREAKINSIYRAAPVGIGIVVNRMIQDVNDYFCQMVGFSKADLVGRSARMFYLDEEVFEKFGSDNYPTLNNGVTKSLETRFKRNDGKILHVILSITPLFEDDRSKGITFTVTDITDRIEAERKLELSHQTYAGIINSVREAIYIQDENGVFLDMNDMALQFYGLTREEILGKTPSLLSAPGKNDNAAINEKVKKALEGKPQVFEFWGQRKDGSIFPNEVSLSPGYYFGKRSVIAVARDITERKQSEESLRESNARLNNVMNSIDALIYVVDMDTHEILFLNDHGMKEFGDVTGQICWKALQEGGEGQCDFCTNHLLINRDGSPNEPYLWEFQNTKTGRWYDCRDQAIPWSDGRLVRLEIAIDVTARKLAEEALRFELGFKEMVADVSSRFVNVAAENLNNLVNHALKLSGEFFDVDRCFIFQFSRDGLSMDNTHEWCAGGIDPQLENLQGLPVSLVPWWASKIRRHEHIHIPNVNALTEEAAAEKEILQSQSIKSVLVIPMVVDGEAIGFYGYDSVKKQKVWTEDQISLLKVLTEIVSGGFGKHQARQALLESEMQLKRAQQIGHIGSWTFDVGTNKLRASDESHFIFGLDPEESFNVDQVLGQVLEPYRETIAQALYKAETYLEPFEIEFSIRRADNGETRDIFCVAEFDSESRNVFGMIQDITERKKADEALRESENLFRTLVENAFDGIYLMEDRRFVYVNDRFCQIAGYSPDEITFDGFNFHDLLTERSKGLVEKRYQDRKEGKPLPSAYEMEIRTKDGDVKEVEISTVMLESGEKPRILGVMRDITYRKRHQNLEQEVAVAKKSAQFKQNFLANMSHEIRTPITGIIGMAEILSKTTLSDNQKEYLNTLRLSTENLREIINQILDYSKIEAGQMQLKSRVFASRNLIENARKVFNSICHKEIIFTANLDTQLPALIEADEPRISQVINNFLSNAVKFTPAGKITMNVRLERQENNNLVLVKVEVLDTGPGIAPELQGQLFRPFAQLDQADQRVIEGTGLGLSISKELAQMMGGSIGVESHPGQGSRFWFTFMASVPLAQEFFVEKKLAITGLRPGKFRILLVEDKVVNQKVITLMLTSLGHVVSAVNNGQQALDAFVPGKFDLILMDIQMPVMDGITATQKLKEDYNELPPIVGLSANAFEGDREKYMNLGMDEYLTKPVQSDDFSQLIDRLFAD